MERVEYTITLEQERRFSWKYLLRRFGVIVGVFALLFVVGLIVRLTSGDRDLLELSNYLIIVSVGICIFFVAMSFILVKKSLDSFKKTCVNGQMSIVLSKDENFIIFENTTNGTLTKIRKDDINALNIYKDVIILRLVNKIEATYPNLPEVKAFFDEFAGRVQNKSIKGYIVGLVITLVFALGFVALGGLMTSPIANAPLTKAELTEKNYTVRQVEWDGEIYRFTVEEENFGLTVLYCTDNVANSNVSIRQGDIITVCLRTIDILDAQSYGVQNLEIVSLSSRGSVIFSLDEYNEANRLYGEGIATGLYIFGFLLAAISAIFIYKIIVNRK